MEVANSGTGLGRQLSKSLTVLSGQRAEIHVPPVCRNLSERPFRRCTSNFRTQSVQPLRGQKCAWRYTAKTPETFRQSSCRYAYTRRHIADQRGVPCLGSQNLFGLAHIARCG